MSEPAIRQLITFRGCRKSESASAPIRKTWMMAFPHNDTAKINAELELLFYDVNILDAGSIPTNEQLQALRDNCDLETRVRDWLKRDNSPALVPEGGFAWQVRDPNHPNDPVGYWGGVETYLTTLYPTLEKVIGRLKEDTARRYPASDPVVGYVVSWDEESNGLGSEILRDVSALHAWYVQKVGGHSSALAHRLNLTLVLTNEWLQCIGEFDSLAAESGDHYHWREVLASQLLIPDPVRTVEREITVYTVAWDTGSKGTGSEVFATQEEQVSWLIAEVALKSEELAQQMRDAVAAGEDWVELWQTFEDSIANANDTYSWDTAKLKVQIELP